jgi:hemerythrin-like domain-containing protein
VISPRRGRREELLATVLHHHHRAEETVLFPALVARQPGLVVTTDELEVQHTELDVALAALPSDLRTAEAARGLVERHLGQEEHLVLPVWLASFTAAEHDRFADRVWWHRRDERASGSVGRASLPPVMPVLPAMAAV